MTRDPMSKTQKRKARPKMQVGDMLVTHVGRVVIDGSIQFCWCVSDSVEAPHTTEAFGPYPTKEAAQADADHYVREQLGPQCEIRHGGQWDPNWNKPQ